MYSARVVAAHTVNWYHDNDTYITNLKLQKLLYFLQLEFFKLNQQQLINEEFYAWDLGPVIPSIYRDYSIYASSLIPKQYNVAEIDSATLECIDKILKLYAKKTTWELVELSHSQNPWKYIYNKYGSKSLIPFTLIANQN